MFPISSHKINIVLQWRRIVVFFLPLTCTEFRFRMKMQRRTEYICEAKVLHASARSWSFVCNVVWSRMYSLTKILNSSIRQVFRDSTPTIWSKLQRKELKLADENTESNNDRMSCHAAEISRHFYAEDGIQSGTSSFDRLDIRKTWVTTKMLVLAYDQSLDESFSLSPDTRVCERNSGQCINLHN
jgi:hypothetical protein